MCDNIWNINLKLTEVDLDMLGQGINAIDNSGGHIDNLDLWGSKVVIQKGEHILRLPPSILGNIKALNLRGCGINDTGLNNLADSIPYFKNMISLNISYNPLIPGSTVKLLQALKKHSILEELHYRGLELGMEDVYALSDLIHSSRDLKRLSVGESYTRSITFGPEVLTELMRVVLSPSSLKTLYIRTNPNTLPLDHIETISDSIKTLQFTSFYEASLSSDDLPDHEEQSSASEKGGIKLSNILRKNISLKELWLEISLDSDEVHSIVQSLEENTSLERVIFYKRRHSRYFTELEHQKMDPRVIFSELCVSCCLLLLTYKSVSFISSIT